MLQNETIRLTLPIYYEFEYKTKKNKMALVGMNNYKNWHFLVANKVKQHYHKLVGELVVDNIPDKPWEQFSIEYFLFYKNKRSDGNNIISVIDKYLLDSLQEHGVIVNDTNDNYLESNWRVVEQSKENPRVRVQINKIK